MGTALLIIYVVSLLIQAVFLFRNMKKPLTARWKILYGIELVSLAAAAALAFYYNSLPNPGFLGMTYFAEIFFSMAASGAFCLMLILSFILYLISKFKNRT